MKRWIPGCADDAWKVLVCAKDAHWAGETLSQLVYIMTDAGADKDAGLSRLRGMSGAEIVDGLIAYQKSCEDSVRNALPRHDDGPA